jgi:hypothetical protein
MLTAEGLVNGCYDWSKVDSYYTKWVDANNPRWPAWGKQYATSEAQLLMMRGLAAAYRAAVGAGDTTLATAIKGNLNKVFSALENYFVINDFAKGGLHWIVNSGPTKTVLGSNGSGTATIPTGGRFDIHYPADKFDTPRALKSGEWATAGDSLEWYASACYHMSKMPDNTFAVTKVDGSVVYKTAQWFKDRIAKCRSVLMKHSEFPLVPYEISTKPTYINGDNSILSEPTVKGPYYSGYQGGLSFHKPAYIGASRFLREAQKAYKTSTNVFGPFSPLKYTNDVYKFGSGAPTNQFTWLTGVDGNTPWGSFQYRTFMAIAEGWSRVENYAGDLPTFCKNPDGTNNPLGTATFLANKVNLAKTQGYQYNSAGVFTTYYPAYREDHGGQPFMGDQSHTAASITQAILNAGQGSVANNESSFSACDARESSYCENKAIQLNFGHAIPYPGVAPRTDWVSSEYWGAAVQAWGAGTSCLVHSNDWAAFENMPLWADANGNQESLITYQVMHDFLNWLKPEIVNANGTVRSEFSTNRLPTVFAAGAAPARNTYGGEHHDVALALAGAVACYKKVIGNHNYIYSTEISALSAAIVEPLFNKLKSDRINYTTYPEMTGVITKWAEGHYVKGLDLGEVINALAAVARISTAD